MSCHLRIFLHTSAKRVLLYSLVPRSAGLRNKRAMGELEQAMYWITAVICREMFAGVPPRDLLLDYRIRIVADE